MNTTHYNLCLLKKYGIHAKKVWYTLMYKSSLNVLYSILHQTITKTINFNRFICVSNKHVSVVQKVCLQLMITIHVYDSDDVDDDEIHDIIKG